ncbi:DgyrCDS6124 [Dimorphilus gyrociliatus]|uniref:DgyrCDS6124 n=1 Tax=Dimorphilus gyrociliatus TaxID=2664684 RepID=A0A7I8VPE8_9ANNE|nr:DgyrCDS6124 [Dimorphilus gyrociliatus]
MAEKEKKLKVKVKLEQSPSSKEKAASNSSESNRSSLKRKLGKDDTFRTKKAGDETSDEEKEWLDALEKGELDDTGRVKKEKDVSLMTARQRSMLTKDDFAFEPEVPSIVTKSTGKNMTAEQRQRRAQKRREQALKKREKEKKDTIERLLKKQDTKRSNRTKHTKKNMKDSVKVKYTTEAICITFPPSMESPYLPKKKIEQVPIQRLCDMPGCSNKRKYSCSKTGKSLCSLVCYKKNCKS